MILKSITQFTKSFRGLPQAVWLLSAVSLINRSGAMVICFMTLYLTQALNFNIKDAGYVMSCYGLGSIAGAYLGGYLTDRFGYYRVQIATLLGGGALLLVLMMMHDFWLLCFITFLWSLVSEAFRPANTVAIKQHSDEATRTRSMSLMRVAVNLAISVALIVGGLLASLGWSWLFWADALTCFGAAIMLRLSLKEKSTPPQYNKVTGDRIQATGGDNSAYKDKATGDRVQATGDRIQATGGEKKANNSAYKDKDYLIFIFLTFLGATVFMQILWTVPAFFKEIYGWNEAMIGMMCAVNGVAVMTIEMPLIFRIENRRKPMYFVRLGIALYGVSYLCFLLPNEWGFFLGLIYMVVISFGEIFVMPFSTSWATKRAGELKTGQYMALYSISYAVANVVAPMMGTQIIAAFGFSTLWFVSACIALVALLGFYYLEKRQQV
jgi:predicted MFS family arabinose efflux permease